MKFSEFIKKITCRASKTGEMPKVVSTEYREHAGTNEGYVFNNYEFNLKVRAVMAAYVSSKGMVSKYSVGKKVLIDVSKTRYRKYWEYKNNKWGNNIVFGTIKSCYFTSSFLEEVLNENGVAAHYYSNRLVEKLRKDFITGNLEPLLAYCDWGYKIKFDKEEYQVDYGINEYWLVEDFGCSDEDMENIKKFKTLQNKVNKAEEKIKEIQEKIKEVNFESDILYKKIFRTTEKFKV